MRLVVIRETGEWVNLDAIDAIKKEGEDASVIVLRSGTLVRVPASTEDTWAYLADEADKLKETDE